MSNLFVYLSFRIARRAHTAKMAANSLAAVCICTVATYRSEHDACRNTARLFVWRSIAAPGHARSTENRGYVGDAGYSPVAARIHAIGRLREQRHQGLRVPGHARFHGHILRSRTLLPDVEHYARYDASRDTHTHARVKQTTRTSRAS